MVDPLRQAEETARNIRGVLGLEIGPRDVPDITFGYVNVSKISRPVLDGFGIPPEFTPVYAVQGEQSGSLYVVLANEDLSETLLLYLGPQSPQLTRLAKITRSEEVIEKEEPGRKVELPNGTVMEIRGRLTCLVRIVNLRPQSDNVGSLQTSYIQFDCYYTTYVDPVALVTTHAEGCVFYIPGGKVTGFLDQSYDEIHDPIVWRGAFESYASGVGYPVASLTVKGHYLMCFGFASTHFEQFATFTFSARTGTYTCEGSHNAWYRLGYQCETRLEGE